MKKIKKILCIFLVVLMCMTSAPLGGFVGLELPEWNLKASALASSGQCGENVYWSYDSDTRELVISGTGEMTRYYNQIGSPFYGSDIKNVVVETGVTSIGDGAFSNCVSLANITLPDSLTYIGEFAFGNCNTLTSVIIPKQVTFIGEGTFSYCESLKNIVIPDSVTNIPEGMFEYCTSLISITIPNTITSIGFGAFSNCVSLANITLPDSLTYIGEFAFVNCNTLMSVIIPKEVTFIGEWAFSYCESLRNIIIPDSVTSIPKGMFNCCTSLTSITIPNTVTSIGNGAFHTCTSLRNITIPDSIMSIGGSAFCNCTSLIAITVDTNNEYYSNDNYGVLFNKDKSQIVQYPAGNTRSSYEIPSGVTSIGNGAFSSCENLTSISISDSVTDINDYAFSSCTKLTSMTVPNSVTIIKNEVFFDCESLINIIIPDNVTEIWSGAFSDCVSLTSIRIPNSVYSIGDDAFYNCVNLVDVYFYGTEAEWNNIYIGENNEPLLNATIHFLGEEEEDCIHKETFEQTIPASCTVAGMKFTVCVECGETIGNPEVIPAAHTPGEWETVIEPTYEAEGKKVKKCTVCGETLEEEILPKLELAVVEDEETGVGLEFPAENYDGEVEIEVEESFDGTAFNILDTKTGAVQQKIYDIKMLVDGEAVQPNGNITVKIPLPEGYNPKFSYVYYVNTETGAVEKMEATYEDGYMVFETDHFSYYAVIAEPDTDNCSCNCHAGGIKKFFFKIGLFFQKIFKKNKTCKCGIKHY